MAEYQDIGGEFRGRFEVEAPLAAKDIQLPQSAAVFRTDTPITDITDFDVPIEEAILDKDRFKITPIVVLPKKYDGVFVLPLAQFTFADRQILFRMETGRLHSCSSRRFCIHARHPRASWSIARNSA